MKRKVVVLIMGLCMLVAMAGVALSGITAQGPESKEIRIEAKDEKLKVEFAPTSPMYNVDEPISFKVKTNKDAFIYLFNITEGSNKAVQIFPNENEKDNDVRAKKETIIPSVSRLLADRPGTEHIVLVASTKKLKLPAQTIKGTIFSDLQKSYVDNLVKEIRVEAREPKKKDERIVEELDIIIRGKEEAQMQIPVIAQEDTKPAVLISSDKINYKLNEKMTISYAADADGYLRVFFINPDKETKQLTEARVEKNKIYKLTATTAKPAGQHMLVAVFEKKKDDSKAMDTFVKGMVQGGGLTKDIQLVQQPDAYAVYPFVIE